MQWRLKCLNKGNFTLHVQIRTFLYNRGMKTINDNNEPVSKDWDNLIKSLDMFTDDFMDKEREQAEQEKREDL